MQWKRINRKQNARWQHLSQLKASGFFSLQQKIVSCMKHNNLYSGLVTPSSGWWSPIGFSLSNWRKVQFNTDLLKQGTRYLYTNWKGWLKLNEMKRQGLMKKQIIFNWGEFNQRAGKDVTSISMRGIELRNFRPSPKTWWKFNFF